MDLNVVAEILKVGLSGLAFLLAYMGYRLLGKEQAKSTPNDKSLRAINMFLWQAIILALLVGGASIASLSLENTSRKVSVDSIGVCRDSLSRLETQRQLPNASVIELKSVIGIHIDNCRNILERLDD